MLTPEATLAVRALTTSGANGRGACNLTCGDVACVQVAATVFLDVVVARAGIEMDIELLKIAIQPVGIISLKDGASQLHAYACMAF